MCVCVGWEDRRGNSLEAERVFVCGVGGQEREQP